MKYYVHLLLVALAAANSTAFRFPKYAWSDTSNISSTAAPGDSHANFVSSSYALDGPQVTPINSTSWDWWYFEAVAEDLKTSVVIIFYTALPTGFPFLLPSTFVTLVGFSATFANGTQFGVYLDAKDASVSTVQDGSSGVFEGAGSWVGKPDMSLYQVQIDSPKNGVTGTFILRSRAPAHYPCGPASPGISMLVGPNIGWSNAMPDAEGQADFKVNGSSLAFTGIAYHDKNWSDQPFLDNVASWYWGHGRLGDFSLVWFDFLDVNGTEYVSAYAAKNDRIITASCQNRSAKVRPIGRNNEYPPKIADGDPDGFNVVLNLENVGTLNINVTVETIIFRGLTLYTRFTGSMIGSMNGTLVENGTAVFEQFKVTE